MATLNSISAALNLIDAKNENLKKNTSTNNPIPNPKTLDVDAIHRTAKDANFPANPNDPPLNQTNGSTGVFRKNFIVPGSVKPSYELSVLCEKMDGVGLRNFVKAHFADRIRVQAELPGALRCAPDPAEMVLQALEGLNGADGGSKDKEFKKMTKSCIMLLKQLRVAGVSVSFKAKEKALKLAMEWRNWLVVDSVSSVGAMGFLHIVSAFGLVSEFSMDELISFSALAAVNDDFPELCRAICLTDRVPDIIQKLINKGKYSLAVKYVLEFDLADTIPPVHILEACVDESKKLAIRLSQEEKPLLEITAREICSLKLVIKIIESNKLECDYLRASLEKRIEQLKRQKKACMKLVPPASSLKPPQHDQQSGIKRPRSSAPVGTAAVRKNFNNGNTAIHQYQQSLVYPSGLFPEHPNPYMSLPAMPYRMVAPTPTIPFYICPSAGPYGHAGGSMGHSGNPSLGSSHLKRKKTSSEPHVPSCYHDRTSTYGGANLQHNYKASYYPL